MSLQFQGESFGVSALLVQVFEASPLLDDHWGCQLGGPQLHCGSGVAEKPSGCAAGS